MINVKFIIENPELIKAGALKKHVTVDIDKIVELYKTRKTLLQEIEELRAKQNKVSKEIPNAADKAPLLAKMKEVKASIQKKQPVIEEIEKEIEKLAVRVPNPPHESVPEGKSDEENVVIETHGKKPEFDFEPKTHIELGKSLDIIDIERGVRTSGARFYYLKNEATLLEFALIQHVMHKLYKKGFSPVIPPALVKEEAMYATGFFPADKNEVYSVNPGEDDLYLIGTSEVPLTMLHAGEILKKEDLPIRYVGFSPCFRREAGSYGKDTAGIIRVHQFDKIEMFSFCDPEKSEEEHNMIRSLEEEIMQDLGLHYQAINICGGDLGAPAHKKYDLEIWIPTQNKFRELTSCSNCTNFQARRANIKYKDKNGKNQYVHTLNGTAAAMARMLVAIIENYQTSEGEIMIPEVLLPHMGGITKISKKK